MRSQSCLGGSLAGLISATCQMDNYADRTVSLITILRSQ